MSSDVLSSIPEGAPWDDRCFIIGEVAQAHDGSLGMAHAFVDAIADAGADAVKFQTHIAAAESTPDEPWRVRFSPQDERRWDYWKRMEFTAEAWHGLAKHAAERGLAFLSSPFSGQAIDLLDEVGVAAWKVASGEVANLPALDHMLRSERPVILSSGMSDLAELDRAVEKVRAADRPLAVLQCTSAYPCPPEKIGLNMLEVLRRRYGCGVGLSDHSATIYPALAAASLGARVIEVHVTLSREMFGPDVVASLTTSELRQMVEGVRAIETMLANPVDKAAMAEEMAPLRDLFTKSVVAASDLRAGQRLAEEHLACKKPGTGIPADQLGELLGRTLVRDVTADQRLSWDDVSDGEGGESNDA